MGTSVNTVSPIRDGATNAQNASVADRSPGDRRRAGALRSVVVTAMQRVLALFSVCACVGATRRVALLLCPGMARHAPTEGQPSRARLSSRSHFLAAAATSPAAGRPFWRMLVTASVSAVPMAAFQSGGREWP